jgi:hypothetical protein
LGIAKALFGVIAFPVALEYAFERTLGLHVIPEGELQIGDLGRKVLVLGLFIGFFVPFQCVVIIDIFQLLVGDLDHGRVGSPVEGLGFGAAGEHERQYGK